MFLKKDTVLGNGRDRQGRWGRRMRNRDKSKQSKMAYVYKNGMVDPITFYAYVRPYFKKLCIFIIHSWSVTLCECFYFLPVQIKED